MALFSKKDTTTAQPEPGSRCRVVTVDKPCPNGCSYGKFHCKNPSCTKGRVPCTEPLCKDGNIGVPGHLDIRCTTCHGKGSLPCSSCGGHGTKNCTCNKGRIQEKTIEYY